MNVDRIALNAALDHSAKQDQEAGYLRRQLGELRDENNILRSKLREVKDVVAADATPREVAGCFSASPERPEVCDHRHEVACVTCGRRFPMAAC